jgi:outer membrane lipoprotein-sorting protein
MSAAAGLCGVFCLLFQGLPFAASAAALDAGEIIRNMEAAYGKVEDYRMGVEVTTFADDGSASIEKFLYSFKKPDRIRLDFEKPHPGLVVIFPDEKGKVFVRPPGLAHLFAFHLSPESRLLAVSPGQRIDQTDLGLLIRNIADSLTDRRLGPLTLTEEGSVIRVRVLAADHFLPGVATLYRFLIDRTVWLPIGVEEETPSGRKKRTVAFVHLRTNVGIPDEFFRTDRAGGDAGG